MKKKTLSVDAEPKSTVTNLAPQTDRASGARKRLLQLSKQSEGRLGRKTWSRESLYDRYLNESV
jgi:hypothetical protein